MIKNLFKKAKEDVVAVKEWATTPDNFINSKVIQKSFDEELKDIINSLELTGQRNQEIEDLENKIKLFRLDNNELISSAEKLKEVGLVNTPSVVQTLREFEHEISVKEGQIKQIKFDIEEKKKMNDMIAHYNLKFPGYKFIPKKEFLKVLEKYNLVMGEASMYCKEIPTKAVNIIHGYKDYIKKGEKKNVICFDHRGNGEVKSLEKVMEEREYMMSSMEKYKDGTFNTYGSSRQDMVDFCKRDVEKYDNMIKENLIKTSPLKMVAPKDHFTIPTINLTEGYSYSLVEKLSHLNLSSISLCTMKDNIITFDFEELGKGLGEIKKVLDPIALLTVNDFGYNDVTLENDLASAQHSFDGVIVLDAWDEEANIPEIKNENLN